jgi:hypothetical protein
MQPRVERESPVFLSTGTDCTDINSKHLHFYLQSFTKRIQQRPVTRPIVSRFVRRQLFFFWSTALSPFAFYCRRTIQWRPSMMTRRPCQQILLTPIQLQSLHVLLMSSIAVSARVRNLTPDPCMSDLSLSIEGNSLTSLCVRIARSSLTRKRIQCERSKAFFVRLPLEQCFPTRVPRNPGVPQNIVRDSSRNRGIYIASRYTPWRRLVGEEV